MAKLHVLGQLPAAGKQPFKAAGADWEPTIFGHKVPATRAVLSAEAANRKHGAVCLSQFTPALLALHPTAQQMPRPQLPASGESEWLPTEEGEAGSSKLGSWPGRLPISSPDAKTWLVMGSPAAEPRRSDN